MTRNDARLLPFCRHCGQYKGLGSCENPSCKGKILIEARALSTKKEKCIICGNEAVHLCSRCRRAFCSEHSVGYDQTSLKQLDQYLGTCVICEEVICEYCWIFNEKGSITCQKHYSSSQNGN